VTTYAAALAAIHPPAATPAEPLAILVAVQRLSAEVEALVASLPPPPVPVVVPVPAKIRMGFT
jgi:hypothetical protein